MEKTKVVSGVMMVMIYDKDTDLINEIKQREFVSQQPNPHSQLPLVLVMCNL